ncbi:DUF1499 domain-containing protein [Billgrantia endophytica]|uniref:DUF1499 domain-containing protein n=1 Tax=Billgrantia endophytica TaxID=2033802 RepID=A0A2N7U1Z4_9GAMM|nr:DUF1499 domain-containing protein [Halomonas endophytica]PMR74451.1 DUF1499 domain-containing protein [Halomonas endophytica]
MMKRRRRGRLAGATVGLALLMLMLAALLMAAAGPAHRFEWLSLHQAFNMLRYGVYAAMAAAGLSLLALLIAAFCRRVRPVLISGLVIAGVVGLLAIPWQHWQRAQAVPPIHDITTDTANPPAFTVLVEAREAAPNAVDYPGERTARQQHDAYPDIGPLLFQASPSTVFDAALAEVRAFQWKLAGMDNGTIEATDTTTWFGFKDDVVIRLSETEEGVRVDVRSASRVGRSDTGTNAERIRAYLDALEKRMEKKLN